MPEATTELTSDFHWKTAEVWQYYNYTSAEEITAIPFQIPIPSQNVTENFQWNQDIVHTNKTEENLSADMN